LKVNLGGSSNSAQTEKQSKVKQYRLSKEMFKNESLSSR